ncbi:MAG TPA: substrate-binding domain-containing protein [Symbiobacteriaceae bacterium]
MRPSPQRIVRVISVLLLLLVVGAVGGNLALLRQPILATPYPVAREGDTLRFVIVAPLYDHPVWQRVAAGAREAASELGVSVEYMGPRRASLEELVTLLDMAAASQVDGIITQGLADTRVNQAIARATDRGIPVITVDTDQPESAEQPRRRLAFVGTDNRTAGRFVAEDLLMRTRGQAVVGIVRDNLVPLEQDQRVQAFREVVESTPGARIAAVVTTELNRTLAGTSALQMLREHPEITVVYATSAVATLGVVQSVARVEGDHPVFVVGWDYLVEPDDYLARGTVHVMVQQAPDLMGRYAVEALEAYLRRDIRPASVIETPITVRSGGDLPW